MSNEEYIRCLEGRLSALRKVVRQEVRALKLMAHPRQRGLPSGKLEAMAARLKAAEEDE